MKLKRTWLAICIWVIFIIFDVVMVASSGFFSGLFPSSYTFEYTVLFTVLSVAVMGVITFLFGRLSDHFDSGKLSGSLACGIISDVAVLAILIGGAFLRFSTFIHSMWYPSGKLTLYENAMVGAGAGSQEYDLLSILYSKLLNVVLFFTGNKIYISIYFQIALFMIFVLCATICCRLLLGRIAAIVFSAYVCFMPVFFDDLRLGIISTQELFYGMFGIELLIIAIFLRNASDDKYKSFGFIIWYVIVGVAIGFMTYVDAGTIVVVLPLLLANFLFLKGGLDEKFFRFMFVVAGAIATFFGMIIQEGGLSTFDLVLQKWANYYFHNLNTFSTFWTYTNYKLAYLITFVVMSGVVVGFWRNRHFESVSPWLLSTMVVFFATPFFGATRMNSQLMLTVYFAYVLACVAELITLTRYEGSEVLSEEVGETDEVKENGEETEVNADMAETEARRDGISEVVKPTNGALPYGSREYIEEIEASHEAEETENTEESEKSEDTEDNEDIEQTAEPATQKIPENENESKPADTKPADAKPAEPKSETAAPRYVPEGMVLPTGYEDELEVSYSNMKMPDFNGVIAIDRKADSKAENKTEAKVETKVKAEPKAEPKAESKAEPKAEPQSVSAPRKKQPENKPSSRDDFDIPLKPGDDFDI